MRWLLKGAGAFLTPNLSARIGVRWLLKGAEFCMFHTIPLQEVTQFVSQQAVSANSFGLISLCGNTLLPGDVLYIPPCSIVVESGGRRKHGHPMQRDLHALSGV